MVGFDHTQHNLNDLTHPKMLEAVERTDRLLRSMIEKMPNDTILFVFGDHGSSDKGIHGGDSYSESHTNLFVY